MAEQDAKDRTRVLRERAEQLLPPAAADSSELSAEEARRLIHELQVHQIELELQNEELRAAQKALEDSRARYLQLFHQAPVGYVVLNEVGMIVQANATFARLAGTAEAPAPVAGRPFASFLASDDQRIFLSRFKSILRHPQQKSMQVRLMNTAGQLVPVHLESGCLPPGSEAAKEHQDGEICVTVSDISELTRAEQGLRASEQRLRAYWEHAPIGVLVANRQGAYLQANPAACHITGLSLEALRQKNVHDLLAPELLTTVQAHFRQTLEEGQAFGEVPYRHPDGSQRWWSVAAATIDTDQVIGFVEDITIRKQLEQQRWQLQQQVNLFEKHQSLSRLAGAVAHYFNNTLTAVLGNLELAIEDLRGLPAYVQHLRESLQLALQAAWRASEMSNQMLTYLGQSSFFKQTIDCSEICRQALTAMQRANPQLENIVTTFPERGPLINGDSKQLQLIFSNVLSNAWEAMEGSNGLLRVTVSSGRFPASDRGLRQPLDWQPGRERYACLEFIDQGPGIGAAAQRNLFDPFYSTKFTGRGMGLAVVLGIVRGHQGGITVTSQPGQGSCFRIYLPLAAR